MKDWLKSKIITLDTPQGERQYLDFKRGAVNFSLLTNDGFIVLCRQARPTTGDKICDACFGGYIDNKETPMEALIRECMEETNVKVADDIVGWIYKNKIVSAGYTNERNSLAVVDIDLSKDRILEILHCNDVNEGIEFKVEDIETFKAREDGTEGELDLLKIELVRKHIIQVETERALRKRIAELEEQIGIKEAS